MDRLTQLREEAGGSRDSTLDSSAAMSEAYITATDNSKYFSLTEDSSFTISPIKDVSLASTAEPEKNITGNEQLIRDLSPIGKKSDLLGDYKLGNQIEAANILSGGVEIFDDNDNSYDGNELVIDDNVEIDEKSNPELKLVENTELPFQKPEESADNLENEPQIESEETEIVLQIDGKNVNAIDIGNGLYLYRKAGEEELAAVQIVADDNDQPTFKFLKVRENAEGNLEVYEEIEVEVPKDQPTKDGKSENIPHVLSKDIKKVINEPVTNKVPEIKKPQQEIKPIASTSVIEESGKLVLPDNKSDVNRNGKMMKFNETRKSPVIHSTPNKEGIPLTKTMVDMQLHPGRPLDKVKTIEVHTEHIKQRVTTDITPKNKETTEDNKLDASANSKIEKPEENLNKVPGKGTDDKTDAVSIGMNKEENANSLNHNTTQPDDSGEFQPSPRYEDSNKLAVAVNKEHNINSKPTTSGQEIITMNKQIEKKEQTADEHSEKVPVSELRVPQLYKLDEKDIGIKLEQNINNIKKCSNPSNTTELLSRLEQNQDKDLKTQTEKVLQNPEQKDCTNVGMVKSIDQKTLDKCISKESGKEKKEQDINKADTSKLGKLETTIIGSDTKSETILETKSQDSVVPSNTSDKDNNSKSQVNKSCEQPTQLQQMNIPVMETKPLDKILSSQVALPVPKDTSSANTKLAGKNYLTTGEVATSKEPTAVDLKKDTQKELTITNKDKVEKESAQKQSSIQQTHQNKPDLKTRLPTILPMAPPKKPETYGKINSNLEKKPIVINNNSAVPFGQWTSANRQEFLNKIKETKVPTIISNTKPISKPNDLNRRDVLKKIDIQRQSSSAASKTAEVSKLNIKNETPTFTNKPAVSNSNTIVGDSKPPMKNEPQILKNKPVLPKKVERPSSSQTSRKQEPKPTVTSTNVPKPKITNRNEFNQQDLIDGVINRAIPTKPQDPKSNMPKEAIKQDTKTDPTTLPRDNNPHNLDAIEMKMNELHGIPFVERPPHELPKVLNRDIKTYAKTDNTKLSKKASAIPNLLTIITSQTKDVKDTIIDLDSEEEVIEHEPITGDIDLPKRMTSKGSNTSADTLAAQAGSDTSKKGSIITEKDFDKFARRNSITCENSLTVNIEPNKNRNVVVQGLVPKDATDKNKRNDSSETKSSLLMHKPMHPNNNPKNDRVTPNLLPIKEDNFNKNYPSKLKMAYQTALTTKRQMESPITILEDKPVKVVFMDSNMDFHASQLNVQGPVLSPTKNAVAPKEIDAVTISPGDSLDSDVLDSKEDAKIHEETKSNKTKHQRKQVLTPVETPELELIVPKDLGLDASPKKKRRTEEYTTEKSNKNVVPKKTYLLGRNSNLESPVKETSKQITETNNVVVSHNDAASAIDNLVKAAELIENQSGSFKAKIDSPGPNGASPMTPAKRGRGRPRKNPLPDGTPDKSKVPSPQKKPRLIEAKEIRKARDSDTDDDTSDESSERLVRENWTMGKINENIVCPICNKLFRSENVVFKHVKHCTGPSPNRSDSDSRSQRRSRSNDSKSMESKLGDTDGDTDSVISKKSTSKSRKSKEIGSNEQVINIEDSPKSNTKKSDEPKPRESRKTKTEAQYKVSSLSCEYCGKNFRQLSYLVSHKLLHKKDDPKNLHHDTQDSDKTVFSCETCKKEFRKLHHLVQHRSIHNPSNIPKLTRKTSSDLNPDKTSKQGEDQSAAFRCEPCDKSFRKLHHLVEHRETHDGINRQKGAPPSEAAQNSPQPPQCDICNKSFRKLHHLIEHKEQHAETEKSEDKRSKSSLSTKDIIHECSLCYMVFPNEHSLNKHSVFCQRKKRSSNKQAKHVDETASAVLNVVDQEAKETVELQPTKVTPTEIQEIQKPDITQTKTSSEEPVQPIDAKEVDDVLEITDSTSKKEESLKEELPILPNKCNLENNDATTEKVVENVQLKVENSKKVEENVEAETTIKNATETPKKKTFIKRAVSATKRRKSDLPLARIKEAKAVESSDDDEVRYMLNPNYKDSKDSSAKSDVTDPSEAGRVFMTVRAKMRNSLQFERPNSRDVLKRRTSYQHPPKIPRLKAKAIESTTNNDTPEKPQLKHKSPKVESVPVDSDDSSEIKYSFPETAQETETDKTPKQKRKPIAGKRKSLSAIARRKSSVKSTSAKPIEKKPLDIQMKKRRTTVVEYRCDCGQLFSSGALLARHTSLAHTPPRVRRRRDHSPATPAPSAPPAPPAPAASTKRTRKSSARDDKASTPPSKGKPGRPPGKTKTPAPTTTRKSQAKTPTAFARKLATDAHRGVPVPEKMKKLLKLMEGKSKSTSGV